MIVCGGSGGGPLPIYLVLYYYPVDRSVAIIAEDNSSH